MFLTGLMTWLSWWMAACQALPTNPDTPTPKREFRATWIATVHNIDWPSKAGLPPDQQRMEYRNLLAVQQRHGMNAVVVQVRSAGDALFPSRYAPWSKILSGTQGKAPEPYYDPVAFMIEEAHRRNMEFHAWLNPFRAVSHIKFSQLAPDHIANVRPQWLFTYGKQQYLDPGLPEVREYVTQIVLELVRRYDLDGLHFDDYFYPYQNQSAPLNDRATFARHNRGFRDIHAWRRDNINLFIKQVSDSLAQAKPHVKLGISPTGVWRNRKEDPRGSASNVPMTSYDGVYADVRKWLKAGWIDYVAPQLYWSTTHPTAKYDALLPWWNANSFGRHLYIGQGLFKTVNPEKYTRWKDPRQFALQLRLNRKQRHVQGSIYYSASAFQDLSPEVEHIIQTENHRNLSLIPPMSWKDSIPPLKPRNLKITPLKGLPRLNWDSPQKARDGQKPAYYVVYRFKPGERPDLENAAHIMAISRRQEWIDLNCKPGERYLYIVTSVDRLHNESLSGEAVLYDAEKPVSSLAP